MGRPRLPDPFKTCLQCGKVLARKMFASALEDRTAFRKRKYCDLICMGKHKTLPPTTKDRIYYQSSKVPLKKECERCGATTDLDRHHKDENPLNNAPENVATLCSSCHTKTHWENGKKVAPRKPCIVCGKPSRRNGMCQMHWFRFSKYGDPLLTKIGNGSGAKLVRVSKDFSARETKPG